MSQQWRTLAAWGWKKAGRRLLRRVATTSRATCPALPCLSARGWLNKATSATDAQKHVSLSSERAGDAISESERLVSCRGIGRSHVGHHVLASSSCTAFRLLKAPKQSHESHGRHQPGSKAHGGATQLTAHACEAIVATRRSPSSGLKSERDPVGGPSSQRQGRHPSAVRGRRRACRRLCSLGSQISSVRL